MKDFIKKRDFVFSQVGKPSEQAIQELKDKDFRCAVYTKAIEYALHVEQLNKIPFSLMHFDTAGLLVENGTVVDTFCI